MGCIKRGVPHHYLKNGDFDDLIPYYISQAPHFLVNSIKNFKQIFISQYTLHNL